MTRDIRTLPVAELWESPLNPRRQFSIAGLEDLTSSIKANGVLNPLIVRPVNGHYEIIAGARRTKAALMAGLLEVPVTVRELDDHQALEIMVIDNLQREDVHPLDEALGYQSLATMDRAYTPEAIAVKVGKSLAYVRGRLKFLNLEVTVQEAWRHDRITAGHAAEIAKLPVAQQPEALEACFDTVYSDRGEVDDHQALISLAQLREWIKDNAAIDLAAPETAELFPAVSQAVEEAAAAGEELVKVASSWDVPKELTAAGVLNQKQYREIGPDKHCASACRAIVVHGYDKGQAIWVCADKACKTHFAPKPKADRESSARTDWKAEQEKQERERKAWEAVRPRALEAVVAKVAKTKTTEAHLAAAMAQLFYESKEPALRKALGAVTYQTFGAWLALSDVHRFIWSRQAFAQVAKKLDIDLKQFDPKPASAVEKLGAAMKGAEGKHAKGKAKKPGKAAGKKR